MSGGCISKILHGNEQPFVTPERLQRGLVVVLPGIEGRSLINEQMCKGLSDGGVNAAIELDDWTTILPGLSERTESHNRQRAEEIALRITRYQLAHPGRPVILVGQSGGGAMAIWIAEAMPPRRQVDGVIVLAGSISPEYRLDVALMKSRRGIVNFYSHRDWFFLGAGTFLIGTMDGKHTSSAGRVGFHVPGGVRPYQKLYQVGWNEEMERSGNGGGHLSSGASGFISEFVVPLVETDDWSEATIHNIMTGNHHPKANSGLSRY